MRRTTIAALVAAGVLLAGCSEGEDDPRADPSGSPSASTPTEPSDPTSSESESESGSAEPSVEPATGFDFDRERITMRAPEGWKRLEAPADFLLQAYDPDSRSNIILSDLEAFTDQPLAGQVRIALESTPQLKVQDPVEIAGVEWYHLAGRDGPYLTLDSFGTIHNDSEAVIDFKFDREIPAAEREETIASVLATVEWK